MQLPNSPTQKETRDKGSRDKGNLGQRSWSAAGTEAEVPTSKSPGKIERYKSKLLSLGPAMMSQENLEETLSTYPVESNQGGPCEDRTQVSLLNLKIQRSHKPV
jgi:hypothetical protein